MADDQAGRMALCAHMGEGRPEVGDVGAEIAVGEIAAAAAEAGEIETHGGDAALGQRGGDAGRHMDVLAAGEAMGEQRIGARRSLRQIQTRGQRMALRTRKLEPFDRHDLSPLSRLACSAGTLSTDWSHTSIRS